MNGEGVLNYRNTATVEIDAMAPHPEGWIVIFAFSGMGKDFTISKIVGVANGEDKAVVAERAWKILGDQIVLSQDDQSP